MSTYKAVLAIDATLEAGIVVADPDALLVLDQIEANTQDVSDIIAAGKLAVVDAAAGTQLTQIELNTQAVSDIIALGKLAVEDAAAVAQLVQVELNTQDVSNIISGGRLQVEDTSVSLDDPMGVAQKSAYVAVSIHGFKDVVPVFSGTGTGIGNGWDDNQVPLIGGGTGNAIPFIISTDANDNLAGTGAQAASWEGITYAGVLVASLNKPTNGTTGIGTAVQTFTPLSMSATTCGSGRTNAGVLSLALNATPASNVYWLRIGPGEKFSQGSPYRVRAAHDLHFVDLTGHASEEVVILIETIHAFEDENTGVWGKFKVQGSFDIDLRTRATLPPKSTLRMTAWSTDGAALAGLWCNLAGYEVPQ